MSSHRSEAVAHSLPACFWKQQGIQRWGLLEGLRPPHLWPWRKLKFEFISLFFIPLLFRMKKVCSLLSSSHLPCYFSSPSGHLLLEISLQLLFPPYLVVYFFQMAKCKRKCCRRGFISKDRQIFNSTLTFIPWQHSTKKLTHPTPISFSGPTKT